MDQAERWIALSDAGAGVEDLLRVNFGRVEAVILDFYHVAEHLGDLARALYPGDESTRKEWLDQWCHRLKHEGGQVVLEALRSLPRTAASRCGRSTARWWDTSRTMSIGWTIRRTRPRVGRSAPGPIESACKTVIGKRMKNGGMRWGEDGADEMCHLRALFASGERTVGCLLASQPKLNKRYTHRSATYPRPSSQPGSDDHWNRGLGPRAC